MARATVSILISCVFLAASARAGDVSIRLDAGTGFVVKNSTGAIERLRVHEATGNISRNGALFVHTSGSTDSLFVGVGAGASTVSCCGADANVGIGSQALFNNSSGYWNTAVGFAALYGNQNGSFNTAVGFGAGGGDTFSSTAVGYNALSVGGGGYSSAFGVKALSKATTGMHNAAFGVGALYRSTTGSDNTAFGAGALSYSTSGSRNVAVGNGAGDNQTTGNDNIYLANDGVAGESGQIRMGTTGTHTATHVAGIHGATSSGGIAVLVNASGTLGTTTSSARFKQDVEDLGDASELLMRLRPVRFHYLEEAVGAEEAKATQYGLIAEEVAEVAPELVAPDAEGKPYSVKYHVLPALLLGKLQQQERTIAELSARLAELETRAAK
jgi:hypothetical protein